MTSAAPPRIDRLDELRGLAVLAIFVVNIKAMVMPTPFYLNPWIWTTEADQAIALAQRILIEDKWRSVFTILFGAGLAMMMARAADPAQGKARLQRRCLWLMAFGLAHILFVWAGDILLLYGTVGLVALRFAGLSAGSLWAWALGLIALGTVWLGGLLAALSLSAEAIVEMRPEMWVLGEEVSALGSYLDQMLDRAQDGALMVGFYGLLGGGGALTLGLMVLGMALFRSGVFTGAWGRAGALAGIAALLAAFFLDIFQIDRMQTSDDAFLANLRMTPLANLDGVLGGFGYVALMSSLGGLRWCRPLGRMAFTVYISCSLLGVFLAVPLFGYGEASLVQLMGFVAVAAVGLTLATTLWLTIFRYGPLEWIWRGLIYRKMPKLLRGGTG